jgi:hypothetical protein
MRNICAIIHFLSPVELIFYEIFHECFIFYPHITHSKFLRSECVISHYIFEELFILIFMYWLIAACGGTVQVNNTARTLRPGVTTDTFISCGWLILGSRGQQIQLSVTSLNLTPCTNLSYSNTSITSCSCSYLEVCFNHSCKIFTYWILSFIIGSFVESHAFCSICLCSMN